MKISTILFCILSLLILFSSSLLGQLSATDSFRVESKDVFALTNNNNSGYVRLDPINHTPRSIVGFRIDKYEGTASQIALSFLNDYKGMFGIMDISKELVLAKTHITTRGKTKLRFKQKFSGTDVYRAGILIAINQDGVIYHVSSKFHPDIDIDTKPTLSAAEVRSAISPELSSTNQFTFSDPVLLVYPEIKNNTYQYSMVYEIQASGTARPEEYNFIVSAKDGKIIDKQNLIVGVTGTGSVYLSNPDECVVTNETLYNLTDLTPRKLNGDNIVVYNYDEADASSAAAYFVYDSTNTHFAEVMAYYHSDMFEDWLVDEMGMSSSLVGKVTCYVHHDNHYADSAPGTRFTYFGDPNPTLGLLLPTLDATVITHEYMHVVSEYFEDLSDNDEEDAMDEAYSDFFAVSYVNQHYTTSIFAEYIDDSETYNWSRNLDNSAVDSEFGNVNRYGFPVVDKYDNSYIFSGALWDFRTDGNVNAADASALVYRSLDNLNEPDFMDGREALVDEALEWEDETEGEDAWRNDVEEAFYAHGIGTLAPIVTISGQTGLFFRQTGTWTANVSNGKTPFSYQWYYKLDGSSTWNALGTSSTQQRTMSYTSFTMAVAVTDDEDRTCTDTHWVECLDLKKKRVDLAADEALIPDVFSVSQNYPNPFNPETQIRFGLPEDSKVTIEIFNLQGQKVATIANGYYEAGYHSVTFRGANHPSSVYFYRTIAGEFQDIKRMLLIK